MLGEQPYGAAADVWSVGVVLREALLRRPPYFDLPVFRAMYLIRTQVTAGHAVRVLSGSVGRVPSAPASIRAATCAILTQSTGERGPPRGRSCPSLFRVGFCVLLESAAGPGDGQATDSESFLSRSLSTFRVGR